MASVSFWVAVFFAFINLITGAVGNSDVAIIVSSVYGAAALIIAGVAK